MQPVVFLGPSLALDHAKALLEASFRPPIRRGDLPRAVEEGAHRVAIVDGEFGQSLAVSIAEVRDALGRGVEVWGSSSMGALRAAECWILGMRGVGWVYEQYRSGAIQADDEVALLFNQTTGAALTTPLVNIRWSALEAARCGRIDEKAARALIDLAAALPYPDRSYRHLLRVAPRDLSSAVRALISWVEENPSCADRKRADAEALLAQLREDSHETC